MRTYAVAAISLLSLFLAGCSKAPEPAASNALPADYTASVEQWRAKHETDYRRDWVSIAALFPLKPGTNAAGSAAGNDIQLPATAPARVGTYTLRDQHVRFEPAPGVPIQRKGQPVTAPIDLRDDSTKDDDELTVGSLRFRVLHTPGHTAGGVCFYTPGHLIAGDTLFPGGPGNTKREGGDFPLIVEMIGQKLFTLPDETRVYPGHGRDTTIGDERPHLQEWIDRGW